MLNALNTLGKNSLLVILLAFTAASFSQDVNTDHVKGQLLFKIKDNIPLNLPGTEKFLDPKDAFFLSEIIKTYQIDKLVKPFFALKSETMQRTFRIEFPESENIDKVADALYKTGLVEYVEKVPAETFSYKPNDQHYSATNQWYLPKINAEGAWDITKGSKTVTIAVVDGGTDINHPDLKANVWVNPGEIAGNNKDDDGNGYIDDINGWDIGDNDNNPIIPPGNYNFFHGSHTAGLAAAVTDNNTGIACISFNVSLIAVKANKDSDPNNPNSMGGVAYAIAAGADVITVSIGGTSYSQTYQNLVNEAYNKGIVVVGAAGNNGLEQKQYPAAYNNVICVAATDENDKRAIFAGGTGSNYGSWVDVSSPGTNILSTVPTAANASGYGNLTGTSMATPIVAGLCGLMLSVSPDLTPDDVKSCLQSTAVNIDGLNSSVAGKLGAGRINAKAAVECAASLAGGSAPVAGFSADKTSGCGSLTVQFSDNSKFQPTSWLWDFGDGTTSSEQNPVHTYNTPNTYSVSLKASNEHGDNSMVQNALITVEAGSPYQSEFVGLKQKGTSSGYITGGRWMGFDAYQEVTLVSIKVYANGPGTHMFSLGDQAGQTEDRQMKTINIPSAGEHRVELNMTIAPGTQALWWSDQSSGNLWSDESGVTGFPFTIPNLISVNETYEHKLLNKGLNSWFFAYDWEVRKAGCNTSVGISETLGLSEINIFPNPGTGDYSVVFPEGLSESFSMEVFDIMGKSIYAETGVSGKKSYQLNLTEIPSGTYLLKITGEGNTITRKIMKY